MTGHVATAHVHVGAPPERVWSALTDPREIATYMMGSQVETSWLPGSPITWSGEYDGKAYQDRGEVLEVKAPTRLAVTHFSPLTGQEDRPENYHRIQYDLAADGDGTRLTLEQDNNATEDAASHSARMWQGMLEGLKSSVESG